MKQYLLLFILLLGTSTVSYTKIGRHNFQINIGGGYQLSYSPNNIYDQNNSQMMDLPSFANTGGLVKLELGYLFHSVRDNNVVHGFDFRIHSTMSFLSSLDTASAYKIYGGFNLTYTIGHQFKWGRFMYDFLGFGVSAGATSYKNYSYNYYNYNNNYNNFSHVKTVQFNMITDIIGPGIQFILNNGFTVGLRNKFQIDIGTETFGWETAFTVGFTIGRGEKPRPPWELYYDKKMKEQQESSQNNTTRRPFIFN